MNVRLVRHVITPTLFIEILRNRENIHINNVFNLELSY